MRSTRAGETHANSVADNLHVTLHERVSVLVVRDGHGVLDEDRQKESQEVPFELGAAIRSDGLNFSLTDFGSKLLLRELFGVG